MIATPNLAEILGAEVVDLNNDRVGKVGRIYLDSESDVPTWVSVRTGLFGLSESLVPVDDATWEGQVLHVSVDKARIKDAPRVDVDEEIAPDDQERLYSYYDRGLGTGDAGPSGYGSAGTGAATAGSVETPERGRHADRSGEAVRTYDTGAAVVGATAMGTGDRPSGTDEPLGGGNQNPAAFESGDELQKLRDAGRSAGSGQLGGGSQAADLLDGDEGGPSSGTELGGGNQNPDRYDGGEERAVGEVNLGGGNQNPRGFGESVEHTGVGASTHGGPGEFSGPGGGTAEASRRAAAEDDPGRMRMTDDAVGEQQGGAMRMADTGGAGVTSAENGALGAASPQGGAMGGADAQAARPAAGGRGMRLRRYVVTEEQTVTMPVTREEFRLEPDDDDAAR